MSDEDVRQQIAAEVFEGAPRVDEPATPVEPPADTPPADAGISAAIREQIEALGNKIAGMEQQIVTRIKTTEGRVGALQSEIAKQAASAQKKSGGEAPSKTQIEDAADDKEAWKELEDTFPAWAKRHKQLEQRYSETDAKASEALDKLWSKDEAQAAIAAARKEAEDSVSILVEKRLVSFRHPGWENDIKTKDFLDWKTAQSDDIKAKCASMRAEDAIAVLDAFKSRDGKKTIAETRQERLARAEPLTGVREKAVKSEADMTPLELRRHMAKQIWGG